MTSPDRTLYQFRISHYCEKTRWLLDHKGLPYSVRELPPGLHGPIVRARGGAGTVPFLRDGARPLGDSTEIARAIEEAYPSPPLVPESPEGRAQAWEIERWFSEKPGRAVRLWMYGQLLANRRGSAAERLYGAFPSPVRFVGRLLAPVLERTLARRYHISPDRITAAGATIEAAFARVEELTHGDVNAYLVGDRLSVADIAAASLLGPIIAAAGTPWVSAERVPAIEALRDSLRDRPGYRWVEARFARDRARPAAPR
jgi:glutathione S-transferase